MFQREVVDRVGHIAQNGANPEKQRKAAEQILAKFHPFWDGFRRGQRIRTVSGKHLLDFRGG